MNKNEFSAKILMLIEGLENPPEELTDIFESDFEAEYGETITEFLKDYKDKDLTDKEIFSEFIEVYMLMCMLPIAKFARNDEGADSKIADIFAEWLVGNK